MAPERSWRSRGGGAEISGNPHSRTASLAQSRLRTPSGIEGTHVRLPDAGGKTTFHMLGSAGPMVATNRDDKAPRLRERQLVSARPRLRPAAPRRRLHVVMGPLGTSQARGGPHALSQPGCQSPPPRGSTVPPCYRPDASPASPRGQLKLVARFRTHRHGYTRQSSQSLAYAAIEPSRQLQKRGRVTRTC